MVELAGNASSTGLAVVLALVVAKLLDKFVFNKRNGINGYDVKLAKLETMMTNVVHSVEEMKVDIKDIYKIVGRGNE